MTSPTYVNKPLLTKQFCCCSHVPRFEDENPYVIMASLVSEADDDNNDKTHVKLPFHKIYDTPPKHNNNKASDFTSITPINQKRRHTHDSVFRRLPKENDIPPSLDSLNINNEDPCYETIANYNYNSEQRKLKEQEELYVTINDVRQKLHDGKKHKKLTKVCERTPTRMKIKRPVSISLPASSSCYDHHLGNSNNNNNNNTICDQWLEVLRQSCDDNDCYLQDIHRTSRRRSANILRATRSNDVNNNNNNKNNNNNNSNKNNNNSDGDTLNKDKIVAYTTELSSRRLSLEKEKPFTKERNTSCNKGLREVCFGPMML